MKTLYILALLVSNSILSQFVPLSIEERVGKSELIINGKIISAESYKSDSLIYTDYQVEVLNVQKGTFIGKNLTIRNRGGVVGLEALHVCPNTEYSVGYSGMFLLKQEKTGKYAVMFPGQSEFFEEPKPNAKMAVAKMSNSALIDYLKSLVPQKHNHDFAKMSAVSISPTTITAGTGDILTITGSGFGASKTSANYVVFKRSNGLTTLNVLEPYNYISWTDTEIKMKVPSFAGSGPVKVVNNGVIQTSGNLNIKFSVRDFKTASENAIYPTKLIPLSTNSEIKFILNSNFTNSEAITTFKIALDEWSCNTNMKWRLDETETTTNYVNASDGKSVLFFKNDPYASTLGETFISLGACSSTGRWYVSSIDMAINKSFDFNYSFNTTPSNKYDYYAIVLHELGHARNLLHTLTSGSIMYPSVGVGPLNRTLDADSIEGGLWIDNDSKTGSLCNKPYLGTATCQSLLTKNNDLIENELHVYPNPTVGKLTIKSGGKILKIEVLSIEGKKIQTFTNKDIDVSNLPKGVYMLIISTNKKTYHKKIIKK